jgi:hypothetical protein
VLRVSDLRQHILLREERGAIDAHVDEFEGLEALRNKCGQDKIVSTSLTLMEKSACACAA